MIITAPFLSLATAQPFPTHCAQSQTVQNTRPGHGHPRAAAQNPKKTKEFFPLKETLLC